MVHIFHPAEMSIEWDEVRQCLIPVLVDLVRKYDAGLVETFVDVSVRAASLLRAYAASPHRISATPAQREIARQFKLFDALHVCASNESWYKRRACMLLLHASVRRRCRHCTCCCNNHILCDCIRTIWDGIALEELAAPIYEVAWDCAMGSRSLPMYNARGVHSLGSWKSTP